jgi:hypothetical protein
LLNVMPVMGSAKAGDAIATAIAIASKASGTCFISALLEFGYCKCGLRLLV